jgi:hypothetical protein
MVNCYTDTIDFTKPEVATIMRARSKEKWIPSYGTGSIAIDEATRSIMAGDVVVPIGREEETKRGLQEQGCRVTYVHTHPEFGVSHVHLVCPEVKYPTSIARVLAGGT